VKIPHDRVTVIVRTPTQELCASLVIRVKAPAARHGLLAERPVFSSAWTIRQGDLFFMRYWLVAIITVSMILPGCSKVPSAKVGTSQQTVVDDIGRSIHLPAVVSRIVSLAPSITEIVFAAGGGNKLVGDTTYCNYPPEAEAIDKVGDTQTPNIEHIIALKPDVVFVSTASQLETFLGVLEQQKIGVVVVDVKGLDDVPASIRKIGGILGSVQVANANANDLESRISDVRRRMAVTDEMRPRVFLQISKEPLFTIGRSSFLTDLIRVAGGVSVTANIDSAYPKLSKETAVALDPQVIVLSESEDNKEPNDAFKNSTAMKRSRVLSINADIISRPGPRLVDALEKIAIFVAQDKPFSERHEPSK
jgi:iron complex transport system substrate-binding protein